MIFIGQASLHRAVTEFMDHYYAERNHQGLANRLIRGVSGTLRISEQYRGLSSERLNTRYLSVAEAESGYALP